MDLELCRLASLHSTFNRMIQNMIHLWLSNATLAIPVFAFGLKTHLSSSHISHCFIFTCVCGHFTHKGTQHNQISSSSYCPCFLYQIRDNKVLLQDTREYLCCSLLQVTCSCRLSKAKPLKDCFGVCAEEWGGIIIHLVALQKGQGSSQTLLYADTTNSSINLGCQTATWNAMLFKGTLHINY